MTIVSFKDVDQLSPRDFELFVRDVFAAAGWSNLEVTTPNVEYRHGDGGVDIFAERGSRRFAIQVKQRSHGNLVGVSALNQVLTGARLANIGNCIIVTNSDFTSEVIARALTLGVDLVNRDSLQDLWIAKRSEIARRTAPRRYQQAIIDDILRKHAEGKSRFLIEMATGLGKTYTVAHLVHAFKRQDGASSRNTAPPHITRTLFVAHRVELLMQAATSFKNVFGIGHASYSLCVNGAMPETTDFLFASIDTLAMRLTDLPPTSFDVIIIDEAHHAPAETFRRVLQHFAPQLLVGLTATPFRMDSRDVPELFGGAEGHVGKLDLIWALQNRKLAFPKYAVMLGDLTPAQIDALRVGMSLTDLDRHLFLHQRDHEIVRLLEDAILEHAISTPKAIVFCRSIQHIRHLVQFFPAGSATLVHSEMTGAQRRANIRAFREGAARYILTCDLFNEGIDIPETNILVFLRQTASRIVWHQQLGRGLRMTPNKDFVHVFDFVGSLERIQEVEALKSAVLARTAREPNRDDGPDVDSDDVTSHAHHDSTIEVSYSKGAADVLAMLERHKLKLAFRSSCIEAFRCAVDAAGQVPALEHLRAAVPSLSLDQIATHFDSYFGLLVASFGADAPREGLLLRARAYIAEHKPKDGMPGAASIVAGTRHESLVAFTTSELVELLGDELTTDDSAYAPSATLGSGPHPPGSFDYGTSVGPKRPLTDLALSREHLLAQYRGTGLTVDDALILPQEVLEQILTLFGSVRRFVRLVNEGVRQ